MLSHFSNHFNLAFRYVTVGGTAYLFHLIFVWLANVSFSNPFAIGLATTASFMFLSVASYFAHRQFTFKSQASILRSTIRFMILILTGAFLSGTVSFIVKQHFDHALIIPAQISFIVVWTPLSAFLMKYFVF